MQLISIHITPNINLHNLTYSPSTDSLTMKTSPDHLETHWYHFQFSSYWEFSVLGMAVIFWLWLQNCWRSNKSVHRFQCLKIHKPNNISCPGSFIWSSASLYPDFCQDPDQTLIYSILILNVYSNNLTIYCGVTDTYAEMSLSDIDQRIFVNIDGSRTPQQHFIIKIQLDRGKGEFYNTAAGPGHPCYVFSSLKTKLYVIHCFSVFSLKWSIQKNKL